MSLKLPPDELEDELFLTMLNLSRSGAGPEFDLIEICKEVGIDAKPMELIRFTSDNHAIRGTQNNTNKNIRFTMNAEGRRHAIELERQRRPESLRDKVGSLPIGKGVWDIVKIGLGALLGFLASKYSGKM